MKEKSTDIGVIVGRFQLHKLHEAHIDLITSVLANHDKVIIFLGTTISITKRNPLDFITRKCMIEETFGSSISDILPLPDQRDDKIWSNSIDTKVREVFPSGSVTIYMVVEIPFYLITQEVLIQKNWNLLVMFPLQTYVILYLRK